MPIADEDWFNQLKHEHIPRIEKMLAKEIKHIAKLEKQLKTAQRGFQIFGIRLFPPNYKLVKQCKEYIANSNKLKEHYACRLNQYKRYANKLERELEKSK